MIRVVLNLFAWLALTSIVSGMAALPAATGSSPCAVLTYWRGRGRANPIRFMLEETGTDWKESFVEGKAGWNELQASGKLMFGQVPLLEIDGQNLVQSEACLRYLARKHDMLGATPAEGAIVDMVHAASVDIRGGVMGIPFQPLEARGPNLAQHVQKTCSKFLPPIDSLLSKSGSGFVTGGESISLADITLFESVKFLRDAPYIEQSWIQNFPSILKHQELIASRPRIEAYLASDRCWPFPDDAYAAAVRASLS
jgi:glutathione S-transferase